MRPLALVGLVLMGLGAFLFLRGASWSSREDVVRVGGFRVSAEREHALPSWVGGVVAVVGLGLVVAGARPRR